MNYEPFVTKECIYDTCGFVFSNALAGHESSEYNAYSFTLNNLKVLFRSAKITPTKTGQFVTLWKRAGQGPIMPFDATDSIDVVVISVQQGMHYGQFVFPKKVLAAKGIFTSNCKDGKRALRVYPPWDKTEGTQAIKTQKWQLDYFLEVKQGQPLDVQRAQLLYNF